MFPVMVAPWVGVGSAMVVEMAVAQSTAYRNLRNLFQAGTQLTPRPVCHHRSSHLRPTTVRRCTRCCISILVAQGEARVALMEEALMAGAELVAATAEATVEPMVEVSKETVKSWMVRHMHALALVG